MAFNTLIDASQACEHLDDANWVFVDCRFLLNDPEQGFRDYQTAHIKSAVYADLNKDLSSPVIAGKTGRHPLPDERALAETFSRLGIDSQCQVVAYDEAGGYMAAARLWWLLNWAGHEAAAVLDGGFKEWVRLGYPTSSGIEQRPRRTFTPHFRHAMAVDAQQVLAVRHDPSYSVVDARANDRYRGQNETIDPVAGHIPGAINAPYLENLEETGRFKSRELLRQRFESMSGDSADKTIFYCGSGVTAAHNALTFLHAGKGMPRLYVGSWSDWITDRTRPIAVGNDAG